MLLIYLWQRRFVIERDVVLRSDYDAARHCKLSKFVRDTRQIRRLTAVAEVYDDMNRTDAGRIGGMCCQTLFEVSVRALHASFVDRIFGFPVPGEQLVEPICGMVIDRALKHIGEVAVGLYRVEIGSLDQRTDSCPTLGATITAGKQMVLAVMQTSA